MGWGMEFEASYEQSFWLVWIDVYLSECFNLCVYTGLCRHISPHSVSWEILETTPLRSTKHTYLETLSPRKGTRGLRNWERRYMRCWHCPWPLQSLPQYTVLVWPWEEHQTVAVEGVWALGFLHTLGSTILLHNCKCQHHGQLFKLAFNSLTSQEIHFCSQYL